MERRTSSSRIYEGRILNLRVDQVTLDDGRTVTREVVEHRPAAVIVPIIDRKKVVLVRQFRYPVAAELLEVPAGVAEPGEDPEKCASRELEEETGYKGKSFQKIMELVPAPGSSTEIMHVYLAQGLTKSQQRTEDDERITVEITPISSALEKIRSGEIRDAKSICALFRAAELV